MGDNKWMPFDTISEICQFSRDRLYKIELLMDGVGEGATGELLVKLNKGNDSIYETKMALSAMENDWWTALYVNAPVVIGEEYTLEIALSDDVAVVPNIAITDDEKPAIAYGYIGNSSRRDKMCCVIVYALIVIGAYFVLSYLDKLKYIASTLRELIGKRVPINVCWMITEIVAALIIIGCSRIEFQVTTKLAILAVSLIGVLSIEKKSNLTSRVNAYARLALYVYTAFAIVGQRILIYPLNKTVTLIEIVVLIMTIIWTIPVVDSVIYYLDKAGNHFVKQNDAFGKKSGKFIFYIVTSILLIVPAILNLIANNPCISLPDTMTNMLENAHNIRGMLDWHPAIYAMFLRLILSVWDSPYAVLIVQYAFWIYVMIEFLAYIRKKGIKDSVIYAIAFLSGINAANFVFLNTILKDILYTYCLLWLIVIIAKMTLDYEEHKGKWYIYVELAVSLVGIYMLRKNGIVTFIIVAGALILVCKKNVRLWVSIAVSLVLIGIIRGPIYNYFEVEPTGRFGMYIGLSQDILGVYYSDGNISEDTLSMINVMTEGNNAQYQYTPTWSFSSYYLDVPMTEFLINYIDTFVKNPLIMTRAIIGRIDGVWDVFDGEASVMVGVNSTGTMEQFSSWRNFYPNRIETVLYEPMLKFTTFTAENQLIAAIVWRVGISVIIGLITIICLVCKNGFKSYVILIAPHVGQLLSLLLSTGWSEFRYFWPYNLMNMFLVVLAIIIISNNKEESDEVSNI